MRMARLNYAKVCVAACVLVGCGGSPAPRASSATTLPVVSSSLTPPEPPVLARVSNGAPSEPCRTADPGPAERLVVDWQVELTHGSFGRIAALAANAGGVLVAGSDSHARAQAEAIVASFTQDGRPRYRVKLEQPRSTLSPGRAFAFALAAGANGEAYVLSNAVLHDWSTVVALSLLDARGGVLFTQELEISVLAASVVADANGDAVVAGWSTKTKALTLFKVARDGKRAWSKSYPFDGTLPRLLRFGDGLALVGSLHGTAEFGDVKLARRENVSYRCAGQEAVCEDGASSLLIVELDAAGTPLKARLLGAPANRVVVSDAAVTAGGHLVVTGEFSGPTAELGKVSLCELEPGMPAVTPDSFRETGWDRRVCTCSSDRRDLFLLELAPGAEPVWATTLAVGAPAPRVAAGENGELRWGAGVGQAPDKPGPATANVLWSLGPTGVVSARRSAPGVPLNLTAGDGALYLSDEHVLRKTSW